MNHADTGTLQKIMDEGKREFFEKGFKGASIRNIVKQAGVTTGAFYFYFQDKEALFSALVSPAANGLKEILTTVLKSFNQLPAETQREKMYEYAEDHFESFIAHIYEHFDIFKLIIMCAEGSSYEDFIHSIVEIDTEYTARFIEATGNDALTSGRCTPELMHIVSSAFYSGIFEIVIHNMLREDADKHIERLKIFFRAGWDTILSSANAGS